MRYVVLDTDVASRILRDRLSPALTARIAGAVWFVSFVTVGELWQWTGGSSSTPASLPVGPIASATPYGAP